MSPTFVQEPPGSSGHFSVSGSLEIWEIALIIVVLCGALIGVVYPILSVIRRRADARGAAERTDQITDTLNASLQAQRALEARLAELEERVAFTERLLTRPPERS